jgi:asparaginyl-tRNA synthetase
VLSECSTGSSLKATGEVVKSPAKGQAVEVCADYSLNITP